VEEYRLELVKESNQHAAETGEKISELRAQLSASQAETAVQKARLEAEIARLQMDGGREPIAAAASWEEIAAERDGLKEKNEKLKVMCKKYVAKLKQLESQQQLGGQSPLSTSSRSDRDGSEAEALVEQLKAKVAALNENNNAALAALEANFAACLSQLDAKTEEAERWERDAAEREAALTAKDDLIRELKEKLEAAPENITVPLLVEDPAEAAKAKAELAAITEKYKKLIVKVRQQNELLKKEKGRSSVTSGSGAEEEAGSPQRGSAASEEKLRLLREETERCAALAVERDALALEKQTVSDQLAEAVASMDELRTENAELRQRISAEGDRQSAVESLTARVERMVAERTALYETQTELKEEIQAGLAIKNPRKKTHKKCFFGFF
jgi:hypothetical protein